MLGSTGKFPGTGVRGRIILSILFAGALAVFGLGPFLRSMILPVLVNNEGDRLMAAAEMAAVSIPAGQPTQWSSRIRKAWPGVTVFVIDVGPDRDGGNASLSESAARHQTSPERLIKASIAGKLLTSIDPSSPDRQASGLDAGWEALVRIPSESGSMAVLGMRLGQFKAAESRLWKLVTLYGILVTILSLTGGLIVAFLTIVRPIGRSAAAATRLLEGDSAGAGMTDLQRIDSALSSAARIHVEDRRQMERQDWEISRMRNDLKGAQTTLIRAEKLASVGQLAAGVAHEIGNPVGIILGMSDVLRQGGSSPEEVQRFSDEIHKATMRVDQTIRELLTFARPVRDEGARADVRQVVESTVKLVQTHKSFRNVMVCIDIGEECPVAEIRPSQLQQVLLNLFLNAAAAMNGEGRIEVSCRCEDRRLSIAVRDFGPGIPEKDLQRIFDPFFTTKPPGEGTGLGLAMSSQIVEIYGGEIEAESRIGEGAVFTVKLWMAQT